MMKMGGQDAACRTEPHLLLPLLVPDLGVVVNAGHDGRLRADDDAALLREPTRSERPQNPKRNHARGRETATSPSQVKTPARHLLEAMNGVLHFFCTKLPVMTEVAHDGDVSPTNLLDVS